MKSKIPRFEAYEEEAEFWDTHDTTEFEDEFEPVEATFAQSLVRRGLTVPLDAQTIELLQRLAREKKTEPATLVRIWILDRMRAEKAYAA
ncbi:MAG: hypothetical protein H8E47_12680 [Anaerolineales bacterium]|nr:hypothetical protein [Anaerolineales bacterium]